MSKESTFDVNMVDRIDQRIANYLYKLDLISDPDNFDIKTVDTKMLQVIPLHVESVINEMTPEDQYYSYFMCERISRTIESRTNESNGIVTQVIDDICDQLLKFKADVIVPRVIDDFFDEFVQFDQCGSAIIK